MTDWRNDPVWRLVVYDPSYWEAPPEKPPNNAELCGDESWASVFDKTGRAVATWNRILPIPLRKSR
jgi:hypothetical protein